MPDYASIRRLLKGDRLTIITMGPIALNLVSAIWELSQKNVADLFIISELPIFSSLSGYTSTAVLGTIFVSV